MRWILLYACALLLPLTGCASAPVPVERAEPAWPQGVAQTCPQRRVSQCCFRTEAIKEAMARLKAGFRACHGPDVEPVLVEIRVETRGGVPSCVGRTPKESEAARCLASVVARSLFIPDSAPEEACSFRYPVRLQ